MPGKLLKPSEARSRIMRGVKAKDTKPELLVRKLLWGEGYRYRLHNKDLPGRPDICFTARRIVIFIHGCFWHHHHCQNGRLPRSNEDFWKNKIRKTQERDISSFTALTQMGWKVHVIWECEILATDALRQTLIQLLGPRRIC